MKKVVEVKIRLRREEIELEPIGMTNGMDHVRPVMLFRERGGDAVLPVWLAPVDAGIALTQHNVQSVAVSPHDVPLQALAVLGVKPDSCHFDELRGHQQYVTIKFLGSKKLKTLRARADHAVSFCLQAKVRFFCTRPYLERCRNVDAEIGQTRMALNAQGLRRPGPLSRPGPRTM